MLELNRDSVIGERFSIIQLSYGVEKANTYIIEDTGHAIIIDACSKRVVEELERLEIFPDFLILTHEHCDHLWGVNAIRTAFPKMKVVAHNYCSEAIGDPKRNKAKQYHIYATLRFGESYINEETKNRKYACSPADIVFEKDLELSWHGSCLKLSYAPGHSPGSILVHMNGVGTFSGDSILQEDTFLGFDDGDEIVFRETTLLQIQRIPGETLIFPGHGDVFRMSDWK